MSEHRYGPNSGAAPGNGDFQAAVARLERAVQALVSTAREQFADRATSLLDDTSARIESELRRRDRGSCRARYGRSEPPRRPAAPEPAPRRLYRDPVRGKIGGVCAGIARYYGVEPWVVRCLAVTGLLFFPTIVFPAYWVAFFIMSRPPRVNDERERDRDRVRRSRARHDHRTPAPELGPRLSPRNSLRAVHADLDEVELRLRRMESHVTSSRYELQRELNRIDGEPHGR